jgi:hypothetical protein
MVLPQIPGDVSGGSTGQHKKAVEDQKSHPVDGKCYHNGNHSSKNSLYQRYRNPAGRGQLGMNGGQCQFVGKENPEDEV